MLSIMKKKYRNKIFKIVGIYVNKKKKDINSNQIENKTFRPLIYFLLVGSKISELKFTPDNADHFAKTA